MSLRVWLPLTKDLRNQGLDEVTVTNNGATFNSAGKLGGCYYFNATSQFINLTNYMTTLKTFTNYSMSAWVYIETKAGDHSASILSSGNWNQSTGQLVFGFYSWSTDHYTKLLVPNTSSWSSGINYNFMQNTWYHITITYNGSKTLAYVNGTKIGEYNGGGIATTSETNNLYVGCATYYGSFNLRGKLNDIRIYDHCLSPMEVKELAKGLVLHYPLNRQGWGQENLITQAMIDADPWKSAISGNYTIDGKTGWILSNNILYSKSGNGANNIFSGLTYDTNTQYTISFKWRDDYRTDGKSSSLYIRFKYSDGTYSQVISSKDYNYWKEEVMTSTAGKTVTAITTTYGNGGNLLFTDLKLEKGTIKTPTSPIVNSDLYNSMGLNSTTEYDCSGFCNNGIRTGTFTWTSDTPKYSVSTQFSGTQYIRIPFPCSAISEAVSVTVWGYESNWNTSSAERLIGAATNSSGWCIGDYGSENTLFAFYANGGYNGATGFKQLSAGWHHFVITFDGLHLNYYVDGQLFNSKTFSTKQVATGNYNIEIGRHYGGGYNFKGRMSDVRIYATALSADDVKSLYQNSAYIDSSGNVYGAVHSEV